MDTATDDPDQAWRTLYTQAVALYQKGLLDDSERVLSSALNILRQHDLLDERVAATYAFRGTIEQCKGSLAESKKSHQQALDIWRMREDRSSGIFTSLHALASISEQEGNLEHAVSLYDEIVQTRRRDGGRPDASFVDAVRELAKAELAADKVVVALGHVNEAIRVVEEASLGRSNLLSSLLHLKAIINIRCDQFAEAELLLQRALEVIEDGFQGSVDHVEILGRLGWLIGRRNDLASARRCLERARDLYRVGFPLELGFSILWSLLHLYVRGRLWRHCVVCAERVLKILELDKSSVDESVATTFAVLVSHIPSDVDGSTEVKQRSLNLRQSLGQDAIGR